MNEYIDCLTQLLRQQNIPVDTDTVKTLLGVADTSPVVKKEQVLDWDTKELDALVLNGTTDTKLGESTSAVCPPKPNTDHDQKMLCYMSSGDHYFTDTLEKLPATKDQEETYWLDIVSPTTEELRWLASQFDIHALTVEDIEFDGSDKLEYINDYLFLTYQPANEPSVSIITKPHCVISFSTRDIRHEILNRLQTSAFSPTLVCYQIIDTITDSLVPHVTELEQECQQIDQQIMLNQERSSQLLHKISSLRRQILTTWGLLQFKPSVIRHFQRYSPDLHHYLEDIHDHLLGLLHICDQSEHTLSRAHSNYMAQLTLSLSGTGVDIGLFTSRCMLLAGVLLLMQFVTLLFGQNIIVPWQFDEETGRFDSVVAWLGILSTSLAAILALLFLLKLLKIV